MFLQLMMKQQVNLNLLGLIVLSNDDYSATGNHAEDNGFTVTLVQVVEFLV